jgi:hypothetical protein
MGAMTFFTAAMIRAFRSVRSSGNGGAYIRMYVYVPPLPRDLTNLKAQTTAAVKNVNAPMLMRVGQELEYRIDMCRVTYGAHIKHL